MPLPLPLPLQQWVTLNPEFGVLLCAACQHAIPLHAVSSHLYREHHVNLQVRKEAHEYIEGLLQIWEDYDFRCVRLPLPGSAPQPGLPVLAGFQCQDCDYMSTNRKAVREHANKTHKKKRC